MNGLRKPEQTPANPRNSGFTLIELLIVIGIIALLIGLLAPAVMSAIRAARDAEVRTEISQLDAAITSFQDEYGGIAPPSQITIYEFGDPGASPPTGWYSANAARSRAIIRRIWPQFNFDTTQASNPPYDFNGDGDELDQFTLTAQECLVFFLGGLRVGTNGPLVGFSKNPARPFETGGNRVGPFFEFDIGRLTETGGNANAPEYLDPLPSQTNPYVYLSSYDGRGYVRTEAATVGMCYAYLQPGLFEDLNCNGSLDSGEDQNANSVLDIQAAFKPNTHQIISPGADGLYGTGGVYDGQNYIAPSREDEDNITNFGQGRLTP